MTSLLRCSVAFASSIIFIQRGRFLHVSYIFLTKLQVVRNTGFLKDLYTAEEMDSANVKVSLILRENGKI